MGDRTLSAGLFGLAALLFWLGCWLLFPDASSFWLGSISVAAALVAGAYAGPRLAADALRTGNPQRGWGAGALVTLAAFVLSVCLLAPLPLLWEELRTSNVLGALATLFLLALYYGLVYLWPALLFGAGAGWLFYRIRLRREIPAA